MRTAFTDLTFCVRTFGCQMNKHDSERICGMLEGLGALPTEDIETADIVVFMTCCVREAADTRLYGQVASLKNVPVRPGSPLEKRIVAVGGCIGQRDGEKLTHALPHLDVVFGTYNLGSLPQLLEGALSDGKHHVEVLDAAADFPTDLPTAREHAWAAWLPITIGCDNFCSYCIVPYVRGREKSRPLEDIVAEAERYVAAGVREITLLGQNVNSYGRDLYGSPRFAAVLDALDATGIERLRFATSHPKDLTDEVIAKFGSLRSLMPALHCRSNRVPTPSGRHEPPLHARALSGPGGQAARRLSRHRAVHRRHRRVSWRRGGRFRRHVPSRGRGGIPSGVHLHLLQAEGTPAATLVDDTPHEVVQRRFDRLVEVVQDQAFRANQRDVDTTVDVLVEGASKRDEAIMAGKSPKNQTVHARLPEGVSASDLAGRIVQVRVDEARTWYLSGEVVGGETAPAFVADGPGEDRP